MADNNSILTDKHFESRIFKDSNEDCADINRLIDEYMSFDLESYICNIEREIIKKILEKK